MNIYFIILVSFARILNIQCQSYSLVTLETRTNYTNNIKFQCWTNKTNNFSSPLGDNMITKGCPSNANFAFVFPGLNMNYVLREDMIIPIVEKLLQYRGGCVCVVDYRSYTMLPTIALPSTDFIPISQVINKKVEEVGNFERMLFYGHSIGSRLAVQVGSVVGGGGKIDKLDLCDLAGPLFDGTNLEKNPTTAGVNVQCIHTSAFVGTTKYNCHQNWRMGYCGWFQYFPIMDAYFSHAACNDYYINSFTINYTPNTEFWHFFCGSTRKADLSSAACSQAKMGYFRTYDTTNCRGDFFVSP